MKQKPGKDDKLHVPLTVQELYNELCPVCKEKIVVLVAKAIAAQSIEERLRKQLESQAKEKP